jgi:hypothetical protein
MPTVTYDGRSFQLDSRRIWMVSGSVHFMRLHPEEWADRLHACRLAGLNTIEVPVFWSRVEPRPGQFEFEGEADLRRFVQLAHEVGLSCIIRPGPFIGQGWEGGGLPAWLVENDEIKVRMSSPGFMEAVSRYFTALADQIRDLQVTAPGAGGPILMVQCEHEWTCGHTPTATAYLGELQRYLREAGITVPTSNSNNLWQEVEGQIDGWVGEEGLFSTMRQLSEVKPDQPRLVIDFAADRWRRMGEPDPSMSDGLALQRRLAEALAAGAQVNVAGFCPGVTPGFCTGRLAAGENRGLAQRTLEALGLDDVGASAPSLAALRPLLSFASGFGKVLAHLDDEYRPVLPDPATPGPGGISVVHQTGTQGSLVWVFSDVAGKGSKKATGVVPLILTDGSHLDVPIGAGGVVWCPLDVNLGGRVVLDYATVCITHASAKLIVAYGPAGEIGVISVNGTALDVEVPKGRGHVTDRVEGVTVVVVNEEMIGETWVWEDTAYVGVAGVRADGTPVPGTRKAVRIDAKGEEIAVSGSRGSTGQIEGLTSWSHAPADEYAAGTSPRFASIGGPAPFSELGSPAGYGWYRVAMKSGATKKVKLGAPESADRLHLFIDGEPAGVLGSGPGAVDELGVSFKKGDHTLTMLCESVGRRSEGSSLADKKGLWGPLYEVAPVKVAKPELIETDPLDPLAFRAPLMRVRQDEHTHPVRVSWSFVHRKKTPLFLSIGPVPAKAMVLLNDTPIEWIDFDGVLETTLDPEVLVRGNNTLQLAVLTDLAGDAADLEVDALAGALTPRLIEGATDLTQKGEWAFAKWEPPAPSAFEGVSKTQASKVDGPTWWRSTFALPPNDAGDPVVLDPTGLTRGQAFLNGRHLGAYAVATVDGEALPGDPTLAIPRPWLREGDNELMFFDEHGGNPTKVKLVLDTKRRVIRA